MRLHHVATAGDSLRRRARLIGGPPLGSVGPNRLSHPHWIAKYYLSGERGNTQEGGVERTLAM
jgi:hypothetical protein